MNRFCGSCGTPARPEDRFCLACGKPIAAAPIPVSGGPAVAPQPPAFAPPRPLSPFAAPVPPAPLPKPETQWHYSAAGKPQGPVAEAVLRAALQSLPPDTLVWHAGLPGWKTAAEVGLKAPAAPAAPAFAPAPALNPPAPAFRPSPSPAAPAPAFAPAPALNPPAPAFRPSPPPAAPPAPAFAPAPALNSPAPGFRPPTPPCAPPAPTSAPSAYAAPSSPAAAPAAGSPMPPSMHWAVVLVLTWVTFGLAGLIWMFKQAAFVKKIDPASKAVMLLGVTLIGMVVQVVLALGAMTMALTSALSAVAGLILILNLVVIVAGLLTVFSMRSSIERYYNTVEPIGLRLSGVMTFFFSILYFQYHFSRIAEWKKTGRLG